MFSLPLGGAGGGLGEQEGAFGDFQKLILGLTEPLLYVAFQIIGQYLLFINCLLSLT
jgi:hypothetical protein